LSTPTQSELLFEEWCRQQKLRCRRIKEAHKDHQKRPDYAVAVPGGWCIVEVKEIEPNDEDDRMLAELMQGKPGVRWVESGARVRGRVRRSRDQLHKFSKRGLPTVALIFDKTAAFYDEAVHIGAAMAGQQKLVFAVNKPMKEAFLGVKAGGGATMTATQNTSISAVAVLRQLSEAQLVVDLHHNPHARVPIQREIAAPFVRHQFPSDVGQRAPIFELMNNPKELQEWLQDPGKLDRTIKEVLAEFRAQRDSQARRETEP